MPEIEANPTAMKNWPAATTTKTSPPSRKQPWATTQAAAARRSVGTRPQRSLSQPDGTSSGTTNR